MLIRRFSIARVTAVLMCTVSSVDYVVLLHEVGVVRVPHKSLTALSLYFIVQKLSELLFVYYLNVFKTSKKLSFGFDCEFPGVNFIYLKNLENLRRLGKVYLRQLCIHTNVLQRKRIKD